MKDEQHIFMVRSTSVPSVEIDFEARAVYVRFSKRKVVKTAPRHTASGMIVAVDLDSQGEVVGIEGVGFSEFNLSKIVESAKVDASAVDLSRATIRQAPQKVCA